MVLFERHLDSRRRLNVLPEIVRGAAERFPVRAAFVSPDGTALSYAALQARSERAACGLRDRGIGEGDVVALVLPSSVEYAIAYIAASKVGGITAGVNPRFTEVERAAALEVARPSLVVDLEEARRLEEADGAVPPLASDLERLVAIVFTSGTTGTPKGAMFANRELLAIARADVPHYDDEASWGRGRAMLASTAFAHVGSMTKLAWYLRLGMTIHLLDRWRATDVLRLISEHRMTSVGGVAPQLALLLREPTFDEFDLSSVQTIVMGGAFSPPALVEEARRRLDAKYSIRYSSTESGGVGTGTDFDADDEESLFTVGRPRGDVEIEIRDLEDRPLAYGEVGEVCLRSSCMMRGYWQDADATAAALRGGWLHSGDLGWLDERGCLRLAGRSKEMFVRGGYNVYPLEVEAVLAAHPSVAGVALIPRPHDVLGEIGVAIVVPASGRNPPSLHELRSFAAERLAAYKLPEAMRLVDALPLTAMQKIDRKALTDREREASPSRVLDGAE
jgi:acyl-CoA synthetase (AMP-forming)/AMP-acid ligase II